MDKLSYALGMVIGSQLLGSGIEDLNAEDFAKAVDDVINKRPPVISNTEANSILARFQEEQEAKQAQAGLKFKQEGEEFLQRNAKAEGVKVTASGLQYKVLETGLGKHPTAADRVRCHYEGRLIDGTVFDSSYKRGEPAVFPLNGVISGWTEGLQLMGEGAKFRFFIPYQLAYGERGAGASIPPYAALVFDVELLAVL
ncbi:MAG: FKBP-type peptidyl-prolyl cis-trans isomerase [Bacteroidaceae bacterium]|nr:FKBP-type peptidyl-prolyl cis-trans isomerase [Bacteroidaceae bacterium]